MASPVNAYMTEFNSYISLYQKQKNKEVENLLSRSLSLLSDVQNVDVFRPNTLECCQFYISLYDTMKQDDFNAGSDLAMACLEVLKGAIRNLDARHALLHEFRFVPLLSKLLQEVSDPNTIVRLLSLIQDLSYGIQIKWEEPYLTGLIEKLVELIYGDETEPRLLALSVLINICYKNLPSIYLLLRVTHASTFAQKIKSCGILGYKMQIIIDDNMNSAKTSDNIHNFIKASFAGIEECFRTYDVPHLKHIVDFLIDARSDKRLEIAFGNYKDSNVDMVQLLEQIDCEMIVDNEDTLNGDDTTKNRSECYALIFMLFECFLRIDPSWSESIPKLFEIAVKVFQSSHASAKALAIMRTVVMRVDEDKIAKIAPEFEWILPNMLHKIEKNAISHQQIIALFELTIALLQNIKTQTVVLSNLTESYFDKIFSPLINTNPDSLNYAKFSGDELATYLLCLQVLIEFSNIAPSVWQPKVGKLFQTKQIHFVIAKCVLSENTNLCKVVFEMAKYSNFPKDDIANITTKLSPLIAASSCRSNLNADSTAYPSSLIRKENVWINSRLEHKLDKLVAHIFENKDRIEFNNVATSELIELFHYKINLCSNTEKSFQKRLQDANDEITNLSHRINLLAHEMSQYYSMNFKLQLTQERLEAENMDFLKQKNKMTESAREMSTRIESDRMKHQSLMALKKKEVEDLRQDLANCYKKEANFDAELKKHEAEKRESNARIDQLKKNVYSLEEINKEKLKILEQKEKEQRNSIKTIEELREANMKAENLVKHLEKQLAAKNERIRVIEMELNETEEMRKSILSIMESKRPKREN